MQTKDERYDAIVIGAGQSGPSLARAFAAAGHKTAIIEREHVGGTCINTGCTPTKTMIASARVAYLARRAGDYGVRAGPVSVDLAAVRARKRAIVESWRAGGQQRLETADNLDLIFGEASFSGPHVLEVRSPTGNARSLEADLIFVDTGTRPSMPRIPGLDAVPALDSTSVMELDTLPEHLLILGGGPVGLEFAQMFRRFGAAVTIVELASQLLEREDPDVGEAVAAIIRDDGVELLLGSQVLRVQPGSSERIALTVRTPAGEQVLSGSHLFVAVGRQPNTDHLNLSAAGIETDERGFIRVNDRLETNIPGVYALGDVNGGPAFTHISYDDFRIVQTNLLHGGSASTRARLVPWVVFIDPQLGHVGLSEREARELGRAVKVAKMPMNWVARALEVDESRGFMKAVVDGDSGEILGCTVLGIEGGELMAMMEIAIMARLPYTALRDGVFAHPTLAESLNNLFGSLDG